MTIAPGATNNPHAVVCDGSEYQYSHKTTLAGSGQEQEQRVKHYERLMRVVLMKARRMINLN